MTDPAAYRRKLDRLAAAHAHAARRVKEERAALAAARQEAADAAAAQALVQAVAARVQNAAHAQIAGVVTRCLEAVFAGEGWGFRVDFAQARGKTEARLLFTHGGVDYAYDEVGGGLVDVGALALRLACLLLARPVRRRLLVADEPMRFLNGEVYQERVAELLPVLAKELGIQFVVCTDDTWLRLGKVIELD